ncbi:hypothetical protein [Haloferula sp. BvORR071]|uniref:hypothetical protein n=1 Tax=Haloferula sp. BvORR071 TaxID=1396141 RepID=UPI000556DE73|nr:hypothetical protein [Haloferula sp. BvORR071]
MTVTRLSALLAAIVLAASSYHSANAAELSADDYEPARSIRGWQVRIEKSLADYPRRQAALDLLDQKLADVEAAVPAAALPQLKQVPLWLSRSSSTGACYHPSLDWLRENKRVIEMARSIEIQNVDNFLDWSGTQPSMILHELSHAWHHRSLPQGYDNPEVLAAFQQAQASDKYEKVRRTGAKEQRHYGMNNAMEYFAECSEAYFGRNDFQPFDRAELKEFDPSGFAMIEKSWKSSTN